MRLMWPYICIYYIAIVSRVLVYKVMQDGYHQQYGCFENMFLESSLSRASEQGCGSLMLMSSLGI